MRHATLLIGAALMMTVSGTASANDDVAFKERFMGFCTYGAEHEMEITPASAVKACACLYDYSREKTPEEVITGVLELPEDATVADFDQVYVDSSLPRDILDDITQNYLICSRTHGEKRN